MYCDKVLNARHTLLTTDWRQNKDFIQNCTPQATPSLQLIDARTKTSYRTVHHKPHPPYNWLTPEQRLHIALYCDKVLNARHTLLTTIDARKKTSYRTVHHKPHPPYNWLTREQRLHIALYCDKVLNARHTLPTTDWRQNKDFIKQCIAIKYWMLDTPSLQLIDARTKTSYRTVHHKPHPPYNWLTPEQRLHIALYCDKVLNARPTLLKTDWRQNKDFIQNCTPQATPFLQQIDPEQRLHIAQYWDKILNARHTLPTTDWRENNDFI